MDQVEKMYIYLVSKIDSKIKSSGLTRAQVEVMQDLGKGNLSKLLNTSSKSQTRLNKLMGIAEQLGIELKYYTLEDEAENFARRVEEFGAEVDEVVRCVLVDQGMAPLDAMRLSRSEVHNLLKEKGFDELELKEHKEDILKIVTSKVMDRYKKGYSKAKTSFTVLRKSRDDGYYFYREDRPEDSSMNFAVGTFVMSSLCRQWGTEHFYDEVVRKSFITNDLETISHIIDIETGKTLWSFV